MQPQRRTWLLTLICVVLFGAVLNVTVSAQRSTFVSPILVVNASFLNVRTGPGTEYSVLTAVVGGTELPVLGVARDFVWYQVSTHAGPGWVNIQYVLPRGDFTNVPFSNAVTQIGAAPFVVTSSVVVNPGQGGGFVAPTTTTTTSVSVNSGGRTTTTGISLNGDLKAEPKHDSRTLFGPVVDPNLIHPVLDAVTIEGTLWYKINFPSVGIAWINNAQKRFLSCTPSDSIGILTSNQQGIPIGTEGYIGQISNNIAYFELVDGGVYYIPFDQLAGRPSSVKSVCDNITNVVTTTNTAASLGQGGGSVMTTFIPLQGTNNLVIVNTGQLNVRTGPGANYSVIARVPGGAELVIVGRAPDNVWYLVQGYFGQGWVNAEFVIFRGDFAGVPVIYDAYRGGGIVTSVVPANLGQGGGGVVTTNTFTPVVNPPIPVFANNNRVIVNTGQLNVRSGPGGNFSAITSLPGGAELPIVGRTNDEESWYLVQGYFGQGWVDSEFVIFRGDFSTVPVIDLN